MRVENENLWQKILDHPPGYADAALMFHKRLALENGWSEPWAERVVLEYKRFVYLAATLGHPVTPSDAVDQAWHLHLAYTRDYWEVFCPQVLGRALHHDPTRGGGAERGKYFNWYARTLDAYRTVFGEPPPDIWPAPERRFAQRFERREVERSRAKMAWPVIALAFLSVLAGSAWAAQGAGSNGLVLFLLMVGGIFVVLVLAAINQRKSRRRRNDGGCSGGGCGGGGGSDGGGGGCGGGGCGGGCGG